MENIKSGECELEDMASGGVAESVTCIPDVYFSYFTAGI